MATKDTREVKWGCLDVDIVCRKELELNGDCLDVDIVCRKELEDLNENIKVRRDLVDMERYEK